MTIKEFILKHDRIYLPYVRDYFGVTMEEVRDVIVDMWFMFGSPHMYNNILDKNYKNPCTLYEACDTKYNRGNTVEQSNIRQHCWYNRGSDRHISVYKHNNEWLSNYKARGTVSCSNTLVSPDWIYIELDRETWKDALKDALKIYKKFEYREYMQLWFSGNRSVHIAVDARLFGSPVGEQDEVCGLGKLFYNIAHRICGDVRHDNGVVDPWLMDENELYEAYYNTFGEVDEKDLSVMKQKLENTDPNLYRINSLIRQPWSTHEKSGKAKVPIDPETGEFMEKEFDINEPKPYLIHWVSECFEPKYQRKPYIKVDLDEGVINQIYGVVEGFDPSLAGPNGWINGMYSPFYEDEQPSVAINVNSGLYKDFGEPTHTYGMVEFLAKYNNISNDEAKETIREIQKKVGKP